MTTDAHEQRRFVGAALSRHRGADTETLKALWNAQPDWRAQCRRCNERLNGTPPTLREHKCPTEPQA